MGDLISRQDAIDSLETDAEFLRQVLDDMDVVGNDREKFAWGLGLVESFIADTKELPSTEPKRKKGKWIEFPNYMAYECSECGRIIQTTDGRRNVSKHYPFCHCGADMRGEQNEND